MYDVIGDIHGHADKLKALLQVLGYAHGQGTWRAPEGRQAVFVGDLIDRGPRQLDVLNIVRRMVDAGHARAVMGNHEFNAIGYAVRDPGSGDFLRPRNVKNTRQHEAFLAETGVDTPLHREWVDWFRGLPMALDLGGLRVVHAWWNDAARAAVTAARSGEEAVLDDETVRRMYLDPDLLAARKLLTCGVERELPDGVHVVDKEGHRHGEMRLAVWRHWATRLRDIALVPRGQEAGVPDLAIPNDLALEPIEGPPVLFGHHWFSGPPSLETPKVACLDWSAAKDGPLVAYRWDGEDALQHDRLVAVGGKLPVAP